MNGEFWDPFAPNEDFEPVRFPAMEPPAETPTSADAAVADEAVVESVPPPPPPLLEGPWSSMDQPADVLRFMLFGEPYEPPEPQPEPELEVEVEVEVESAPEQQPEPLLPIEWAPEREEVRAEPPELVADEALAPCEAGAWHDPDSSIETDSEVGPPVLGWDFDPLPDAVADQAPAPEPTAAIYLPGEKPPTLTAITAPRLRVGRGVAIALALHLAVLGTALWMMRVHLPAPPPDGPVVAVVMEMPPHGNTPAPVPTPHLALPAPAKLAARLPPLPPPPAPPALPVPIPAELPLPAPPTPPVPAAPAKAAPPVLVQGIKAPDQREGSQLVRTTHPASPDAANPSPYYPPVARGLGEEGQVDLSVEVLASGQVGHVVLAKSSGYPRLDEAARQSLLSWRFHPAMKNGVPVASIFTYYVRYQLQ
jgi:protein TonB